jgi:hypothetical protein
VIAVLEHAQLAVLYVAPAALLALVLLCGRYPGETALAVALRRAAPCRLRPTRAVPPPRRRRPRFPRGGALVAHALAGRAPPW